jgi:toxin ParE1/3/4
VAERREPLAPVRLRLSGPARIDIEDLLAWSEDRFGVAARQRYEALLTAAPSDVAQDPARQVVEQRPELGSAVFSYHISHSRRSSEARSAAGVVAKPQHLLAWRVAGDGTLDIVRVLHDAMELSRHLPQDADERADPGGQV